MHYEALHHPDNPEYPSLLHSHRAIYFRGSPRLHDGLPHSLGLVLSEERAAGLYQLSPVYLFVGGASLLFGRSKGAPLSAFLLLLYLCVQLKSSANNGGSPPWPLTPAPVLLKQGWGGGGEEEAQRQPQIPQALFRNRWKGCLSDRSVCLQQHQLTDLQTCRSQCCACTQTWLSVTAAWNQPKV